MFSFIANKSTTANQSVKTYPDVANAPSMANQSVGTYSDAIKKPAISDAGKKKPPVLSSRVVSESNLIESSVHSRSRTAENISADFRSKEGSRVIDPSFIFYAPCYAQKRESEATEATRNIVEKHGNEPYAQERVTLTEIVASARSANPPRLVDGQIPSDRGNFGAALVCIKNVPERLIASSYLWAKPTGWTSQNPDSHNLYRIVRNTENHRFPSEVVGDHKRNVDSEAKILNFIAAKLEGRSDASGTIILYTEIPPCMSCKGVISAFKKAFPAIALTVLNNGGNRPSAV